MTNTIKQLLHSLLLATQALLSRGKSKDALSNDWVEDELHRYEAESRLKDGLY
jgi:hypothetical protein